ncbi:ATPase, T2SS/T4P/T4SS family [Lysinibacillus fusiformis]|uniref:ATPase, T2SS/T4P/T4SS family n=1 Tax=Lysinibacillus fusiformis TaxID=28031 RepID=UPI00116C843F|nr:ATPase, T2SS/T4P/T4SS family [Lysinibacillus fusiformis]MED4672376.1 ATPase, T2SS/T4P/T4SS family [Lysinibacillus fusiformis]GED65583.1 hypothetical protein LFU01_40350 [Lysinibacillus fusiformis]
MSKLNISMWDLKNHIEHIEDSLFVSHPALICSALTDASKRDEIKKVILKQFPHIATDDEIAETITREIVGTGLIEDIITNREDVTDIGYDGNKLEIVGVNYYEIIQDEHVNEKYIQRLIQKFASAMGEDFSPKRPKLNGVYGVFRINAVHSANTTGGTTLSLRIVRPKLALNEDNFNQFAPAFILDFLKTSVETYSNTLISGRPGTGKTELQKLAMSYTKDEKEKIGAIQDVPELFLKELYPNKLVYEWLTGNGLEHNDLIFEAMRNNFVWILVTEIINKGAYGLYQAMYSDHAVITTLHAKSALKIPMRTAYLAKFAPEAAMMDKETMAEEIEDLADFGWHIKRETVNGKDFRFLNEIAAFAPGNSKLIFKQKLFDGVLYWETFELPTEFKEELERLNIELTFPENTTGEIPLYL